MFFDDCVLSGERQFGRAVFLKMIDGPFPTVWRSTSSRRARKSLRTSPFTRGVLAGDDPECGWPCGSGVLSLSAGWIFSRQVSCGRASVNYECSNSGRTVLAHRSSWRDGVDGLISAVEGRSTSERMRTTTLMRRRFRKPALQLCLT